MNSVESKIYEEVKSRCLSPNNAYGIGAWDHHIKLVYELAKNNAESYGADKEIVAIAALLHDIALICKIWDRKDHHINGEKLANEILIKYNYSQEKKAKVLKCVYNHRSSKNAESIEELCVADADILAHFDNIPMLFNSAFNRNDIKLNEIRDWMKTCFEKDYNDLSDKTKEVFEAKYKTICEIVLGE